MKKLYTIGTLLLFLLAVQPARATVMLASPFTSHMVLQSDMKVPVWGVAEAGEVVTVTFAGQKESATADADGHWRLDLQPMKVSAESRIFTVTGSKTAQPIVLADVLVGEVWLASGQSNMDFSLSKKVKYFAGVTNEEQEIAAANYPLIRMFIGTSVRTNVPQTRVGGEWQVCTPQTAPAFCAVGYFFARDLQREIKAPIGIVALAFGASTAEAWISREALAADAQLKPTLDRFDAAVDQFRTNPPPVVAAPAFAIRKPAVAVFTLDHYVAAGIMLAGQAAALRAAVADRKNILVAGGTSTGKTTLTNALLAEIAGTTDRVVLIEDTRELQCRAPNLVALRTKDGVASLSDLVRSSLRLRPDRIPIGEVRGAEALDLLKAWGTGHPGGIGTIHAGTALGALRRLEQLIQEAVVTVPRALIAETIDLVAVLRGRGSERRLSELAFVAGLDPATGDYRVQSAGAGGDPLSLGDPS